MKRDNNTRSILRTKKIQSYLNPISRGSGVFDARPSSAGLGLDRRRSVTFGHVTASRNMAPTSARRWLPRVTKDRTISRGEAVSRCFRQPPCRRSLQIATHGGGRRRDAIRHQVDHTATTEPVPTVEHREQHNLRGGGHFLENHHR